MYSVDSHYLGAHNPWAEFGVQLRLGFLRMPKTQEWISRENIARFRQLIAEAKSDEERARLEQLLAEEEIKHDEAERRLRDGDGRKP